MHTVGHVIRARRQELGLTLQATAEMAECTKSYLSTIENGRRESPPSSEMLGRIERALRLEAGKLVSMGNWESMPQDVRKQMMDLQTDRHLARRLVEVLRREGVDKAHRSGELRRIVDRLSPEARANGATASELVPLPLQVPVINRVAAGYPREFTDLGYPARVADEHISVPDVSDPDAFAARVVGDSMAPDYREGDVVVFSPAATISAGDDCFVRLERDAETTFKRVYFEKDVRDGEMIRLQPLNSAYGPRTVSREDVAGLYAAVYVVRAVGKKGKAPGTGDRASGRP